MEWNKVGQKYKVFINGKLILFQEEQLPMPSGEGNLILKEGEDLELALARSAKDSSVAQLVFVSKDIEKSWNQFKLSYELIEAAGGLVKNTNGEMLFIFRNGKWDLPKGKVENQEAIKAAALREVREECSIGDLAITKPLVTTRHVYSLNGKQILKTTWWFEMTCLDKSIPKPQVEEGITEVKWVGNKELDEILSNTFPSVIEVVQSAKSSV